MVRYNQELSPVRYQQQTIFQTMHCTKLEEVSAELVKDKQKSIIALCLMAKGKQVIHKYFSSGFFLNSMPGKTKPYKS